MKYKTLLLVLSIFAILVFSIVFAQTTSKLSIESVKSFVDGKKDTGIIDVDPGSDVKFKVKAKNLFTKTTGNLEIEDITVTVTIFDIDDGDDLEEESDEFDLDPEDDDTVDVEFKIPLEVEEDTFKVEIKAEGEDQNGTKHTDKEELKIDVEKESHELLIRRAVLSTNNLKCSRTTQLSLGFMNLGTSQEDVKLTVTNVDVGLSKEISFTLDDDPFDSESKYNTNIPILVSNEQARGTYPISIKAEYANGAETKDASVDLVVEECVKKEPEKPKETVETVIQPTQPQITPPLETEEEVSEEQPVGLGQFVSNNIPIILIVGIDLIVIIVAIVLVMAWVRKK